MLPPDTGWETAALDGPVPRYTDQSVLFWLDYPAQDAVSLNTSGLPADETELGPADFNLYNWSPLVDENVFAVYAGACTSVEIDNAPRIAGPQVFSLALDVGPPHEAQAQLVNSFCTVDLGSLFAQAADQTNYISAANHVGALPFDIFTNPTAYVIDWLGTPSLSSWMLHARAGSTRAAPSVIMVDGTASLVNAPTAMPYTGRGVATGPTGTSFWPRGYWNGERIFTFVPDISVGPGTTDHSVSLDALYGSASFDSCVDPLLGHGGGLLIGTTCADFMATVPSAVNVSNSYATSIFPVVLINIPAFRLGRRSSVYAMPTPGPQLDPRSINPQFYSYGPRAATSAGRNKAVFS